MKKQLISILLVVIFSVPFLSSVKEHRSAPVVTKARSPKPTRVEFGDFQTSNGVVYFVYGDSSTNLVTDIWYSNGTTDVQATGVSGSYVAAGWPLPHGANPYLSGVSGTGIYGGFSYTGPILFY